MKPKTALVQHRESLGLYSLLLIVAFLAPPVVPNAQAEIVVNGNNGEIAEIKAPEDEGPDPFERPEDRERVPPMPWPEGQEGDPIPSAVSKIFEDSIADTATLTVIPGGAAMDNAIEVAREAFVDDWATLEALDAMIGSEELEPQPMAQLKGTPGVFTRYSGNLHTQMWQDTPWRKIGKLYFINANGGVSYCTANVISRNNIIVTSAHCLYTRGRGWHSNFRFVPAERVGAAPFGVYGWQSAAIMTNWITIGGRRWDIGMIRLTNNPNTGLPVSSHVGWLGRAWDLGYVQNLHSVGYGSNLSTQFTHICTAESFHAGLDVLAKGCDMTFGSSGGGWIWRYHPYSNALNIVVGVTSGPYPGHFGTTFVAPRFSSSNFAPLCNFYNC